MCDCYVIVSGIYANDQMNMNGEYPNEVQREPNMNTQDEAESVIRENNQTPDRGKSVIREWVPVCENEEAKPKEGMTFDNLLECEKFYKIYAHHVCFSVRKSSTKRDKNDKDGLPKYKTFVCSKEGFKDLKHETKEKVRNVKLSRVGCAAMIRFKKTLDGKYVISKFYEGHTHELATPRKRHLLKSNRKVTTVHRCLYKAFSRANVGASKAYHYIKEQVGGFENVGCSKQDLKNFQRDLSIHIKDNDVDMFIDNFKRKQKINPSFYFAYELDATRKLKHVFWADGISRKNYALYGDVLSFDTTYDSNRYKKIFAPFTGVDNHRHCVTFGAAFLGDETKESFSWLFQKFLDAMGGHKPNCIITDQDPAMKIAIEKVFDTTTHRFCIWHIMRKLSEKVSSTLSNNEDFMNRFKACVYGSETPVEFELAWNSIINDFELQRNEWLSLMFSIRKFWIPAYFRDVYLGNVLRTTSRSESENSFFSNFTNPHLSLVEFWMRFESALESQRHTQLLTDHENSSLLPELKTKRELERHASLVYTFANFYKFQEQMWLAFMDYEVEDKKEIEEGMLITVVNHADKTRKIRQVVYDPLSHIARCSCKLFECEGIPCRHILCILKGKGLHEIPNYYVLDRWTKKSATKPVFDVAGTLLEGLTEKNDVDKLISDNWLEFLNCMEIVGRDLEKLTISLEGIRKISIQLSDLKVTPSESKAREFESFIGSNAPEEVEILPPEPSKTKGSGKRLRGGKEVAMEKQEKKKRLCRSCGLLAHHDSRNCNKKAAS